MRRPTIFLMLAMVAAVLAAIVVFSALKNREAQVQVALAQTEDIVVAARDVHLGEKLTGDDVKLVDGRARAFRKAHLPIPRWSATATRAMN